MLHFGMGSGDDVSSDETIANTLAGIGTGANGGVNVTGFTAYQNAHVATTDEFAGDQGNFSCLGHGVSRLNGGHQAAGFDHAEGDAVGRRSHRSTGE